ncbi:MAG: serine/threonine protein phosphatase [Anaerolineae bacterium]|nr:serine/threonine protein phosphatase [Anaerolineae bacterium]
MTTAFAKEREREITGMQPESMIIQKSYWVIQGRFRAGEYPGSVENDEARAKLRWLLDQEIYDFVDLTQPGEDGLIAYESLLRNEAKKENKTVRYTRLPMADFSTPSQEQVKNVLGKIERALQAGGNIYLHCYGGKGRTGTVVGCYLAEHGYPGESALRKIEELRRGVPDHEKLSPETDGQRKMVIEWNKG